jgi:hypothetical protein
LTARRIAFLGVGRTGLPMAGHLLNAGRDVLAIEPSAQRRRLAVAQGLRCVRAAAVGHISDGPPRGRSPQSGAGPMAVDGQSLERAVVPDDSDADSKRTSGRVPAD